MAGLLEWSNTIRYTMANDPGRQLLQDQLNTHGFIFLNDYLNNILSGPSQDPLIELVKTPGRKKAVSKKPKGQSTSKLNNLVSLEDDGEYKENVAPINKFHKALLKAKDETLINATNSPHSSQAQQERSTDCTPDTVISFVPPVSNAGPELPSSVPNPSTIGLFVPSRSDQNDLSVIAEDDENSESNILSREHLHSHPQSSPNLPPQVDDISQNLGHTSPIVPIAPSRDLYQAMNVTELSSDTFHSVALDSPLQRTRENVQNPPMRTPSLKSSEVRPSLEVEDPVASLPEIPARNPPGMQDEAITTSFPVPAVASASVLAQDVVIPLRDHDHPPISPKSGDSKFSVALFPALPAPMPLRKSIRAPRDPSMGTGQLGAATPGGMRTSWLKKAREVKALEVTSKHTSTLVPPVHSTTNALKRKSGDMLMVLAMTGLEDEERQHKSAKNQDGDVAPLKAAPESHNEPSPRLLSAEPVVTGQEGMLDRFKRTVEDLGARVGKSMGKSLGAGAAVSALAEARAAAEARVAERHFKEEEMTKGVGPAPALFSAEVAPPTEIPTLPAGQESIERRLSISDLFPPNDGSAKIKSKSGKAFQFATPASETLSDNQSKAHRESTTTTPPDSPPATRPTSFILPSGPVFNKPPPVFVPPVPVSKPKDSAVNLPSTATFSMHAPTTSSLTPGFPSSPSSKHFGPLSKQSTLESMKSDTIFDDTDVPAWMPNTQDTEDSSGFDSRSQDAHQNVLDEDDSWPLDEKLAAGVQWTFDHAAAKEDSMTWSTLPSQSQRADTGISNKDYTMAQVDQPQSSSRGIPGAFDIDMEDEHEEDAEFARGDSELEEIIKQGASTVSLIEPKPVRSESQMSMASSQSSQSQSHTGFLGQASKLLSSALGASKKGKPEVKKVLQMAAVAAKKQQEENDKKAARLKEMENRRQLAIQRKAEEEKTRALEQERKVKEEGERRKREREETTDKRPLKMTVKKDEDATKKRKITVTEDDKKELKKFPSKSTLKSLKQPSALSSSAAYNTSLQTTASTTSSKPVDPKSSKPQIVAPQKGKGIAVPKLPVPDDDLSQPSQLVQIQMAARAKAQLQAANLAPEPPIASESIELPEINSEYSDSEDEDRPKSFPEWAQSPELREALQLQSTINPDDIFGAIRPLRMEELFKTRTSRFRARTSSANWTGADRLTLEEEREYAKRMGFK